MNKVTTSEQRSALHQSRSLLFLPSASVGKSIIQQLPTGESIDIGWTLWNWNPVTGGRQQKNTN